MRMKYVLLALAPVGLLLQLGSASAVPNRGGVRWEGTVEPEASRLVIHNLSARPAKAFLGAKAVYVPADGVAEIPTAGLGDGLLRLHSTADLLVLQAEDDFDAGLLEIEKSASVRSGQDKLLPRFGRPDWTRELIAAGPNVRHGATGAVSVKSDNPAARTEVAVEFLAPHSSVRIRQFDTLGNEVASVVASSSRPVRWRASLGPVNGESRIELQTLRGESQGTAAAVVDSEGSPTERSPVVPLQKAGGGLGKFEPAINWDGSPNLYYRVTGGPPNLCGDVYTSRNGGPYVMGSGWMCLDANGNGLKGPWTWASQSGDETAYGYMVWSNGLSTNTDKHIWDKTGPSVTITPSNALPAPIYFKGTGSDPTNGAGFSSSWSSRCTTYYYDLTTHSYWDPTYGYNNYFPYNPPNCTISGMPSHNITWQQTQIPPGYAHTSGHCYEWGVYLYESNESSKYDWEPYTFCVP